MNLNVFWKPRKAFEDALDNPSAAGAFIIVLLTGVILGATQMLFLGNAFSAGTTVILNIVEWIVLAIVVWFFSFMFKKHKKLSEIEFGQVLSVTGRLWVLVLAASILLLIGAIALAANLLLLVMLAVLLLVIVAILFLIALFVMVKLVFDADRGAAALLWILLIVLDALLIAVGQLAILRLF